MSRKIRIGLIGCSAIAFRSILPAIMSSESYELVMVGSRSLEKSRLFGDQFGCKFGTYEDVLEDTKIDSVYVSLPVGLHAEWGYQVLLSGKNLLLEKTFTTSYDTAMKLISEATVRHLIVMEALPYVYHPLFRQVRDIVFSGLLGNLRLIEARFAFPYLPDTDIRNKAELGGGATLDALVYPLSFCLYIGNSNYTRYSFKTIYEPTRGIDTQGFVQIEWENYIAQIAYGFGFMYRNAYTVWGEKAYLTADRVFSRPKGLAGNIHLIQQGRDDVIPIKSADQFQLMLDAFAQKVFGADTSGVNEGEDILNRMKIISSIHESCYSSLLNE
jgi:dTDP-3,4-didehydro-2,6-dideoxy-alpha-D-glucose 3-reductase